MAAKTSTKRPARGKLQGKTRQAARKTRRSRGQGPYSYTVTQAGAMIGLSRSASYRAVHSGQIPAIEVNGGWIVPRLRWDGMLGIETAVKPAPQTNEQTAEIA